MKSFKAQHDLIRDKVFYVRQDLRKIFGGREFVVRVVIDREFIRVHIRPAFREDECYMSLGMREEIRKIADRYSNYDPMCPWDEMQMAQGE